MFARGVGSGEGEFEKGGQNVQASSYKINRDVVYNMTIVNTAV